MTERDQCQRQIDEMNKLIDGEALENVRAKYERSLKAWEERMARIERTGSYRQARLP